ncbi:hypothetical protein C6356_29905 [Bacillus wiedmannii]|uniref:hypothetical protein n=1 Tax=Bacillus wiedmannii TaxID=1890302 RepID=UPI000D08E86B|nr:hypothetical protein [Bacillus wiedmannii]PRS99246.1 hypothetical protein C6356_29905 [Bacillus wiedmannii]
MPNTPEIVAKVKQDLEAFGLKLTVGNERSARLERFEIDGTVVFFKLRLHSEEEIDNPRPIPDITVYSVTYYVEGSYDLLNPGNYDEIDICVDTPVGKICKKAKEIVEILVQIL